MSEMKPSFYLAAVDFVSLTHEEGADALHTCATVSRGDCKLQANDIPLYTADQLAEAMAARDALIRDLRKELNERRYGRSAEK